METVWLVLVALMVTTYVVLDGFDLGAGTLYLLAARSEEDRRKILRAVGPVWDGNEVWLLAGGGTLYFAFPKLYASSFSGFYLPLMIVLWLIVFRGLSLELRNHVGSAIWTPPWDFLFGVSSTLLAIFYGAALGNVIRGVPLEPSGYFFLPLWTDLGLGSRGLGGRVGVLDWYTVLVGLFACATLTLHGARWIVLKTDGPLRERAGRWADRLWWAVMAFLLVVTVLTFQIQSQVLSNFRRFPLGYIFPLLALAGLAGMRLFRSRVSELHGFLASCLFVVGMLASAAFGIFPYLLPSNSNPSLGLTACNTATAHHGLLVGLFWWIPGMLLVIAYFTFLYRRFAGKVNLEGRGY